MSEFAPAEIRWLYDEFKKAAPKDYKVQLSGIMGDRNHWDGYHRSRNALRASGRARDYSVTLAADKAGNGDACSALDISMSAKGMREVTARLIAAAESATDDRPSALREFYGTLNGSKVEGRSHESESGGWREVTSDKSHTWHVHLSFFRKYATDKEALRPILSILLGDDDMPSPKEFMEADVLPNPSNRGDHLTNPFVKLGWGLSDMWRRVIDNESREKAILAAVTTDAGAARVEAAVKAVGDQLADLRDLVEKAGSGELTADAVVAEIARRLGDGS